MLSSLNDVLYLNVTNVIEDRDFAAVFVLPILDPSGPIWIGAVFIWLDSLIIF